MISVLRVGRLFRAAGCRKHVRSKRVAGHNLEVFESIRWRYSNASHLLCAHCCRLNFSAFPFRSFFLSPRCDGAGGGTHRENRDNNVVVSSLSRSLPRLVVDGCCCFNLRKNDGSGLHMSIQRLLSVFLRPDAYLYLHASCLTYSVYVYYI